MILYLIFGLASGVDGEIAGAKNWNMKEQKAYGICMSLYEQHPVNGKMSGNNMELLETVFCINTHSSKHIVVNPRETRMELLKETEN